MIKCWDSQDMANQGNGNGYNSYNSSQYRQARGRNYSNEKRFDRPRGNWEGGYSRDKFNRRDDSYNSLVMRVDCSKVGKIIGKQGATIKNLQQRTNTRIKIGGPCQEDGSLTEVIITGTSEGQGECEKLINDLVYDSYDSSPQLVHQRPILNNETTEKSDFVCIDWHSLNKRAEQAEKERWENLPPLEKNFYVEHPDVKNMTKEEVEKFRENNNNIIVKFPFGKVEDVLNPIQKFEHAFGSYPEIMREIKKQGFETPSPIQCQAWPILLSGKDLIGIAQTGTGKTLAFLLPALIHIDRQPIPRSERGGANVLVLAPTRELALQIEKEVQKYSYKDIKCVCVYGGGSRNNQVDVITSGVEIIIATPGRLNDLIESKIIDVTSITYLVLDEADRMLDMGFEPQIRKTLLDIRPDKQAVMTSATWNPFVQRLAERYMNNPIQVYIGSLDLAAVHSVTQTVWVVEENRKEDYLMEFIKNLDEDDKVIVFVGKKRMADHLSCNLILQKISCQSIHGDREQIDREQALEDLKTGEVRILIATDVASRGLDILDITKVFNYDFPKNLEEYVHRVGRTGRAGRRGEAVTLFTRADWANARELITIMEEANQDVPEELYEMRDRYLKMIQRKNEERAAGRGRGGYSGRGRH